MASIIAEIEETMKQMIKNKSVLGYALFSPEAIPIKYHNIDYTKSVQYAAIVSDLMFRTKVNMRRLLPAPDCDVERIRIRTTADTELIISTLNDYVLLVV
jgi:hypothetical protein